MAVTIAELDADRGATASRSPDDAAALVLALDAGLFLQQLDPDAITPEQRADACEGTLPTTRAALIGSPPMVRRRFDT